MSELPTMATAIELLRNKAMVPAQEGIGRSNRGDIFQALVTERVGERREAPAFGVGQAQPATPELGFKDTILFLQVGDDLWLVTLNPPGNHGNQHVEDHGHSSGMQAS